MLKKIVLILLILIALAGGGGLGYLYLRKPASASPVAIRVDMSPQRVARGRYLFERLANCDGCHSIPDETRFGRPVLAGKRGAGVVFPKELGLPGDISAPNITPDRETGLGEWTDGEKIRAIREGIGRDGRVLFPMMPYPAYRQMSDEDAQSLVAYMNALEPVRNPVPPTRVAFLVSLMIKSVPRPVSAPVPAPSRSDKVKYGEYLTRIGGCPECHTPHERGQPNEAKRLAGGREFRLPNAVVVSANISPDPETGIGRWSEPQFLDKFYQYKEYVEKGSPKVGPEGYTLMPWLSLAQLPPEDLAAIFAYLKTQRPVYNSVETHPGFSDKKS